MLSVIQYSNITFTLKSRDNIVASLEIEINILQVTNSSENLIVSFRRNVKKKIILTAPSCCGFLVLAMLQ